MAYQQKSSPLSTMHDSVKKYRLEEFLELSIERGQIELVLHMRSKWYENRIFTTECIFKYDGKIE